MDTRYPRSEWLVNGELANSLLVSGCSMIVEWVKKPKMDGFEKRGWSMPDGWLVYTVCCFIGLWLITTAAGC